MYKALTRCPVCQSQLKIKKLQCERCSTMIENDFSFSKFELLSSEQIRFVETFLKYRGNIKDVERSLSISYPTVRGKLEEINEVLGLNEKEECGDERETIIARLENGEITPAEAVELLKKYK